MRATEFAPPPFIEHLFDAVNAAQVGFHFEEGGCYGMALAIHRHLRRMGEPSEIVITPNFGHALVRHRGRLYDSQGVALPGYATQGLSVISEEQLLAAEDEHGVSPTEMESDADLAEDIIKNAEQLDWSKWNWETRRWR